MEFASLVIESIKIWICNVEQKYIDSAQDRTGGLLCVRQM
jgi:hypothetical protein